MSNAHLLFKFQFFFWSLPVTVRIREYVAEPKPSRIIITMMYNFYFISFSQSVNRQFINYFPLTSSLSRIRTDPKWIENYV